VLDTRDHRPVAALLLLLHVVQLLLRVVLRLLRDVRVVQGGFVAASTVKDTSDPCLERAGGCGRDSVHVVGILALRRVRGGLDVSAIVLAVEDLARVLLGLLRGVYEEASDKC